MIIKLDDLILVTGAGGFIGKRVISCLQDYGFKNIRYLIRPSIYMRQKEEYLKAKKDEIHIEKFIGNLLSAEDCAKVTKDVKIVYHLAAGRGEKSYPGAFLNSVVTTRNLLDACIQHNCIKRFVNVSSFAVYTNCNKPNRRILDEECPTETSSVLRGSPYCYAKVKQEEMVLNYAKRNGLRYVIIRPGVVYGPGNEQIHGRVGIGTFGIFLHLGGSNKVPFTYVDNCALAIVLAGIQEGIDGEVFNVVDNDLPTSREFLKLYKKKVYPFKSIYIPKFLSYLFCYMWERYSIHSNAQLPNVFNRKEWHATWKKTIYSNEKLKNMLRWSQKISTKAGMDQYYNSCYKKNRNA